MFWLSFTLSAEQNPATIKNHWILAQNGLSDAFDPFIDYGEFQDNVAEEKSINFFQNGRSLNISLLGGYEGLTLNMRQIYGDSPFIFGMAVSFFFDLHFAFQVNGFFPYEHYNSLLNTGSQFSHYGIDLKYYLNQQYLNKEANFFNPYFIFGPFWISIKSKPPRLQTRSAIPVISGPSSPNTNVNNVASNAPLSNLETQSVSSFTAFGAKIGLGFELSLIKQSFMGLEIAYLYTNLEHENEDLSGLSLPPIALNSNQSLIHRIQFPNRPQLQGYRFLGDLINITVLFGVNF